VDPKDQDEKISEYMPRVLDYVAALDANHVCLLLVAAVRLSFEQQRVLVPIVTVPTTFFRVRARISCACAVVRVQTQWNSIPTIVSRLLNIT